MCSVFDLLSDENRDQTKDYFWKRLLGHDVGPSPSAGLIGSNSDDSSSRPAAEHPDMPSTVRGDSPEPRLPSPAAEPASHLGRRRHHRNSAAPKVSKRLRRKIRAKVDVETISADGKICKLIQLYSPGAAATANKSNPKNGDRSRPNETPKCSECRKSFISWLAVKMHRIKVHRIGDEEGDEELDQNESSGAEDEPDWSGRENGQHFAPEVVIGGDLDKNENE